MYLDEIINEAIEQRLNGVSAKSVCEKFGISASTQRKWEVDYLVIVPAGMTDSQLIWKPRRVNE